MLTFPNALQRCGLWSPNALLSLHQDDSIILHPLPRIDEISTDIDKTKNAKYFEQAEYGKYTRAALLGLTLNENGL